MGNRVGVGVAVEVGEGVMVGVWVGVGDGVAEGTGVAVAAWASIGSGEGVAAGSPPVEVLEQAPNRRKTSKPKKLITGYGLNNKKLCRFSCIMICS